MRLLTTRSRVRLNLGLTKETKEDVFDVAQTAINFARTRKPKSIAKLPLPDAAVEDCEQAPRRGVAQRGVGSGQACKLCYVEASDCVQTDLQ